jgi:endonuclease/exonuclease/phosphatase family metal-dependent hydrolase
LKLRIGTWNIKGGRGAKGFPVMLNKKHLNKIAEVICLAGLQVVALQEVDLRSLRSMFVHQPLYLAGKLEKLTGRKWFYLFAPAIRLLGGYYGNAILAAYPLQEVLKLSLEIPGQRVEKRVFLFAHLLSENRAPVGIGSFHLSVKNEYQRLQEIKKIKAALRKLFPPVPLILGGDLNGRRGSAAFQEMLTGVFPLEELGPGKGDSFTAPTYRARIDFLFGKGVTSLASGIVDTGETSDHHLVWVECEI